MIADFGPYLHLRFDELWPVASTYLRVSFASQ